LENKAMIKIVNSAPPEFPQVPPIITTLRHDLNQKINLLIESVGTLCTAAGELEKLRVALEGIAPACLVPATAHGTCIPIPADAVIVAKKHEVIRAFATANDAFEAMQQSVRDVLGSASLPDNEFESEMVGAEAMRLPYLLPSGRSGRPARRSSLIAALHSALLRMRATFSAAGRLHA
jgi:hypothetical protein